MAIGAKEVKLTYIGGADLDVTPSNAHWSLKRHLHNLSGTLGEVGHTAKGNGEAKIGLKSHVQSEFSQPDSSSKSCIHVTSSNRKLCRPSSLQIRTWRNLEETVDGPGSVHGAPQAFFRGKSIFLHAIIFCMIFVVTRSLPTFALLRNFAPLPPCPPPLPLLPCPLPLPLLP